VILISEATSYVTERYEEFHKSVFGVGRGGNGGFFIFKHTLRWQLQVAAARFLCIHLKYDSSNFITKNVLNLMHGKYDTSTCFANGLTTFLTDSRRMAPGTFIR
jgi:hypothetical protein